MTRQEGREEYYYILTYIVVQQDEVPWRKKIRVEVREEVEEEGEYREVLTQKILLE